MATWHRPANFRHYQKQMEYVVPLLFTTFTLFQAQPGSSHSPFLQDHYKSNCQYFYILLSVHFLKSKRQLQSAYYCFVDWNTGISCQQTIRSCTPSLSHTSKIILTTIVLPGVQIKAFKCRGIEIALVTEEQMQIKFKCCQNSRQKYIQANSISS